MGSVTNRCLFMAEQHRSSGAPTRRAILHAGSNVQQWLARLSSPPILNASPEAAAGGGLALLKTGDRVRIDLNRHTADRLISADELEQRRRMSGDFPGPGAPDTFAEALPQHGRPARDRRLPRACNPVRRHLRTARQSAPLTSRRPR
jgi:hypothetical protein